MSALRTLRVGAPTLFTKMSIPPMVSTTAATVAAEPASVVRSPTATSA